MRYSKSIDVLLDAQMVSDLFFFLTAGSRSRVDEGSIEPFFALLWPSSNHKGCMIRFLDLSRWIHLAYCMEDSVLRHKLWILIYITIQLVVLSAHIVRSKLPLSIWDAEEMGTSWK